MQVLVQTPAEETVPERVICRSGKCRGRGCEEGNESSMVSYLRDEVRALREQEKTKQDKEKAGNDDTIRLLVEREKKVREQWQYQQEMQFSRDKLMQELMINVHNNNLHQQMAGSAYTANMIGNVAGCINLNFKPKHATRSLPLLPPSTTSPNVSVPFPSEFHYGGGPHASDSSGGAHASDSSGGANREHGGGGERVSSWGEFTQQRDREFQKSGERNIEKTRRKRKREEARAREKEGDSKERESGS